MKTILYASLILGPVFPVTTCYISTNSLVSPPRKLSAPEAMPVSTEGGWEGQTAAGVGVGSAGTHTTLDQILIGKEW